MSVRLHLGVRTTPGSFKRITLNNVNLSAKISDLKVEAGKATSLPMESLELSFCGNILEDEQTILECNLQSGVTVHVLKKHVPTDYSKQVEKMTPAQVKQLAETFTVIFLDPAYSNSLHELMKQPNQTENLMLLNPALKDDPVAVAILQDPVLMERIADLPTAEKIAQHHPALAETANYIAKAVEDEAAKPNSSAPAQPVNYNDANYPYHMEDYTDEEEMDSSQSSDSVAVPTHGPRGQITSSQLAAALASATGGFSPFNSTFPGPSQASTSSGQSSSSGSAITPDMLQSALASFSSSSSSSPLMPPPMMPPPMMPPPPPPPLTQLNVMGMTQAQQIQQMHEVGLRDDVVNIHALSITGGDVQAAINLVLSGVITGDDED